jgi:hypothetical protein
MDEKTIANITHPDYDAKIADWNKFRATYEAGHSFVENYVKKFSVREGNTDFENRKNISYCPSHAKSALITIKNSIYSRLGDIVRAGGSKTYMKAVVGENGGVDRKGSTMTNFIGCEVLSELLHQSKVGVYVDKPKVPANATLAESSKAQPYLYVYKATDIRSWTVDSQNKLTAVLLRDNDYDVDAETGLSVAKKEGFRLLKLDGQQVLIRQYDDKGKQVGEDSFLKMNLIPFAVFELSDSLLKDVADYQIALANIASSDLIYGLKSNYPFYTEQFDPAQDMLYARQAITTKPVPTDINHVDHDGKADYAATGKDKEIKVGLNQGRRYPKGLERPGFIHPSSEPLIASLEHRKVLKEEIRQLINLSLANIDPKRSSAESKKKDDEGLEAGLSYIGVELERGERMIGRIWSAYEGDKIDDVSVKYPQNYSLKSDEDRREEASDLEKNMDKIPSPTYQKALAKRIVQVMMGPHMSQDEIEKSMKEIDAAEVIVVDSEILAQDIESGLVSLETASSMRGYKAGEVEKASEDRAKRAAAVALAQSKVAMAGVSAAENQGARGNVDSSADPKAEAKAEKQGVKIEKGR